MAVPTPAVEQHSEQPSKRPVFLKPLEDTSITEDSTVNLECTVLAHPTPSVSWFLNRAPFEPTSECSLSFDGVLAQLQIEAVSAKFSGMFKCVATNSLGSARTLCNLSVQGTSLVLRIYVLECNGILCTHIHAYLHNNIILTSPDNSDHLPYSSFLFPELN